MAPKNKKSSSDAPPIFTLQTTPVFKNPYIVNAENRAPSKAIIGDAID